MSMRILCAAALLLTLLIPPPAGAGDAPHGWETVQALLSLKQGEHCELDVRYPVVTDPKDYIQGGEEPDQELERVRLEINRNILAQTLDLAGLIQEFNDGALEPGKCGQPPYSRMQRRVEWAMNHGDENLSSWTFQYFEYMGGAHPMNYRRTSVVSMETGQLYNLADFLSPEFLPRLIELIIQDLEGRDLYMEDFFHNWRDEIHSLDQINKFEIRPAGITILFDPYEIGPYSMGPAESLIPWDKLAPGVPPQGPGAPFLADG